MSLPASLREAARDTPVVAETEVLVLGGGPAGIAAAASAAAAGRKTLQVESRSGRGAIRALQFIDASGDADLARWAGAPWDMGNAQGQWLYPTLMFRAGNVDNVRAGEAWREIDARMDAARRRGTHSFPRKGAILRPMKHDGEWRVGGRALRVDEQPGAVSVGCFVMGQAAGLGDALAVDAGTAPADLRPGALQSALERQGAWLRRDGP